MKVFKDDLIDIDQKVIYFFSFLYIIEGDQEVYIGLFIQ